ncbi:hypothetical protein QJ854_gp545 [Moumouvirus goulette]|uniref:Uncharacterized protein n=1 Tax=Moumouvirus goulette TaxID=1247379 RepID=M1PWV0_9VIRU|nr:hypothetical protein QJ854_gp545 [Moumouvirus goulette]AGF85237.1 hypothetical protein glt_00428 [Moumouvirus goulette]
MSKINKILSDKKTSDLNDSDEITVVYRKKISKKNKKKKNKLSDFSDPSDFSDNSDEELSGEHEEFNENESEKYDNTTDNDGSKWSKNSNEIFKELIKKQLPDVPSQWRLNINDMKRICKYIDTSIFDKNKCCLWNGYITNINNSNKGTYVNFYFRNKKVALHRLLYSNFVAPLNSSEYLKFNCDNKGICCNINHYEKYKYSKNNVGNTKKEHKNKESKKEIKEVTIAGTHDPDELTVDFE